MSAGELLLIFESTMASNNGLPFLSKASSLAPLVVPPVPKRLLETDVVTQLEQLQGREVKAVGTDSVGAAGADLAGVVLMLPVTPELGAAWMLGARCCLPPDGCCCPVPESSCQSRC